MCGVRSALCVLRRGEPTIRSMSEPRLPPAEQVWAQVVRGLDQDPAEGLNTARECCDRHAGDRSRLAITVRHPDGQSQRWTYFDLSHHASMAADMFAKAGLRRGDRVAAVLSRQQELPGGECPQGAAGAEFFRIDSAAFQELLERPAESEVRGEHPRRRKPFHLSIERELDADAPAGAIEEHSREPIRGDVAKVVGDADFGHLVGERADPLPQLGQGGGVGPAATPRRAIAPNTEPGHGAGAVR